MDNAGYDHPLFSFVLVREGAQGPDEPPYFIPVPEGRLMLRKQVRVRGMKVTTAACDKAVQAGLALHAHAPAGFGVFGMGPAWADNVRHWLTRMHDADGDVGALTLRSRQRSERSDGLLRRGAALWGHLRLSARLAGLPQMFIQGRTPRSRLQLLDALSGAQERARESAEVLARHGFGPAEHEALAEVLAALGQDHRGGEQDVLLRRGHSAALAVVRGALLGDLSRLCQVAPRVLPTGPAEQARIGRLLDLRE